MDTRAVLIFIIVELLLLVALVWVLRKLRAKVPDDTVLLVQRGDRRVPYLPGQGYWLWPEPQIISRLSTGKQVFHTTIPHIVVGSGLSVDVNLRYTASLAVDQMAPLEHLFDDTKQQEFVASVMKRHLQRLVEKFLRATDAPAPNRLAMGAFVHPLFGEPLKDILKSLRFHTEQELKRDGIILTEEPLEVDKLILAPGVVDAYHELAQRRFEAADRYQFVKQIEAITPGVSENALVQLYFAVDGPNAPLHRVLSTGTIPANMLIADRNAQDLLFGDQMSPLVTLGSLEPQQDYPLTVEEMRLLKDLGS